MIFVMSRRRDPFRYNVRAMLAVAGHFHGGNAPPWLLLVVGAVFMLVGIASVAVPGLLRGWGVPGWFQKRAAGDTGQPPRQLRPVLSGVSRFVGTMATAYGALVSSIWGLDPAQPRRPLGQVRSDVYRFAGMVITALGALVFIFGIVLFVSG